MHDANVTPEQYRTFVELATFVRRWSELRLSEHDRLELMGQILRDPERGDVVPGGGGLRKARFTPADRTDGKSGGYRIYYANLVGFGVVVLAVVFAKNEAGDIGPTMKAQLRKALERLEAAAERLRQERLADKGKK